MLVDRNREPGCQKVLGGLPELLSGLAKASFMVNLGVKVDMCITAKQMKPESLRRDAPSGAAARGEAGISLVIIQILLVGFAVRMLHN